MPRKVVVYGNTDEFGLGVTNLYQYQGTERIDILNRHVDQDTITMVNCCVLPIEAAKIGIGSSSHFFHLG